VPRGRQGGGGQHRARRARVRAGPQHPAHDDAQAGRHVPCEHPRHDGPLRRLAGGPARHPVARPGAHRLRRARPRRRRLRAPRQRVQREQPGAFHRTRHRPCQQARTLMSFVAIFIKCSEMRTLGSPLRGKEIARIAHKAPCEHSNVTKHSKNSGGRICLAVGICCVGFRPVFRCITATRRVLVCRIARCILGIIRLVQGQGRRRGRSRGCRLRLRQGLSHGRMFFICRRNIVYPIMYGGVCRIVLCSCGFEGPGERRARRSRRRNVSRDPH